MKGEYLDAAHVWREDEHSMSLVHWEMRAVCESVSSRKWKNVFQIVECGISSVIIVNSSTFRAKNHKGNESGQQEDWKRKRTTSTKDCRIEIRTSKVQSTTSCRQIRPSSDNPSAP